MQTVGKSVQESEWSDNLSFVDSFALLIFYYCYGYSNFIAAHRMLSRKEITPSLPKLHHCIMKIQKCSCIEILPI